MWRMLKSENFSCVNSSQHGLEVTGCFHESHWNRDRSYGLLAKWKEISFPKLNKLEITGICFESKIVLLHYTYQMWNFINLWELGLCVPLVKCPSFLNRLNSRYKLAVERVRTRWVFTLFSRLSVDFFHRGRSEGLRRHKTVGLWRQSLKRTARWQFPTNRTNAKCFPVYLTVDCFSAGNRRSRRLLYLLLSSTWI